VLGVERQREAEIGVKRALVELVEQHRADAVERWVVEDHAGENALGHDLDARLGPDLACQAGAQADGLADRLAERFGHALGGGAGGEPARLQDQDLAAVKPRLVKERERHARRLAGPGRGDEHGAGPRRERAFERVQHGVDGQGGVEMHGGGISVQTERLAMMSSSHPLIPRTTTVRIEPPTRKGTP
jgi:hypothetical protein